MKPKTIAMISAVVLLAILIVQNTHSVELRILFWKPEFPLILLIFIAIFVGFGAGYVLRNISRTLRKKYDEEQHKP
jgi:uncharacterized integral membrane protein